MRARLLIGSVVLGALLGIGMLTNASAASTRHWSIVNVIHPLRVADRFIMGPVLIVHDDVKMANGEPCTTFYRFEPGKGPQEELVSFHCRPLNGRVIAETRLTVEPSPDGCKKLLAYQLAGDAEAHGVPER